MPPTAQATSLGPVDATGGLDLDQAVVEARRAADVGEALVRQLVAVLAVGGELPPPDAEPVDDARPRALADDGLADDATAVVEDANALAIGDAARRGVDRRDLE